ncbi:hypothetical protein ECDEC3F_4042 [Escherichia coli DEC3F]|nr:hypothetical protein ECDEC3D_3893 [Escherichia coli DEC3D]EHU74680.1 hypothetical protein ECDEC3E_4132 [Escherichia coli DEC3E]EHU83565.1 hypothetical protein ECDEC3F_4042 [Escherichia coli DEC3F]EHU93073.1 hypothetical protein ECDEC4B_3840 [Escherichia coli DEC4B]EHV19988.1 hypothetical protein ECDEC4F_3701 [Escherichia coli DEC4F]EHV45683.1 hypothetical protein ECDEC5E_3530 [Escherichia coli DEC5E]EIO26713.1 hypothetical protein ECPA40_4128 [Escherichia coli PA40]EIO56474.1 hypothetical
MSQLRIITGINNIKSNENDNKKKKSITYFNSLLLKKCCFVEIMLFSIMPGNEYCQTSFFLLQQI